MNKTMRITGRMPLFILSCVLLAMLGYASVSSAASQKLMQQFKKEGQLQLALSDCFLIAMQRNFDILLAQEALIQADAEITQARSAMLPSLGAEGSYVRLDKEIGFSLGPQFLTFIDQDTYKAGIVIRYPIFVGGQLNASHKASQYSKDAQYQEKRRIEQEVVFQVTRAYRTAQLAEAFQDVAVEAVNLLEAHEHDVVILVEKGANPEIDMLRTRTELANARKEMNGAYNAVDLAYSALKNLLSLPLEESVSLTEALVWSPGPETGLLSLTKLALSQRPGLSAMDSKIAVAEQALKAAKGEYLPTIALEGRYEYMEGDFRDLEGGDHWTVGVGAQLPLWNWGKTAAEVREARSQLAQVRIQRDKTTDRIRLEVRQAFLELGKAEKNIEAAESALETAKEAYRQARAGYRAGEGTNTDVLDVRTALSRAEANHTQALFDYNVSLAALHRAVGAVVEERLDIKEKESAR